MKKVFVVAMGLALGATANVWAADTAAPATAAPAVAAEAVAPAMSMEVTDLSIAAGIENRAPVGIASSFSASTERVYCFTKINGGKEGDSITHRWLYQGKSVAEVTLKVNGSPWRTYSSKYIGGNPGKWSVEVVNNGQVLKTEEFELAAQ